MLEKLVKGRYLSFSEPRPKLDFRKGEFVEQPPAALMLEQSVSSKQHVAKWDAKANAVVKTKEFKIQTVQRKLRVSQMTAGKNLDKVHRNFQWLGYWPGMISEVKFNNLDVLSGSFSGCWMVVYRKEGTVCVGHVGTKDEPTHEFSVAVRTTWNQFAKDHPGDVLRGFNPARAWTEESSRPSKTHGDGVARIWGLVTPTQLISVYLFRGEMDRDRYRIADWKVIESASYHDLSST